MPTENLMYDTALLTTDADLTAQESRMPEAAQKVRGESGKTAYDGKRALAKKDLAAFLKKKGLHTRGLTNPLQLSRAATFLELSMIYADMASRNDAVSWDKAKRYQEQFKQEMDSIDLDYDPSLVPAQPSSEKLLTSIPLWRA